MDCMGDTSSIKQNFQLKYLLQKLLVTLYPTAKSGHHSESLKRKGLYLN